MSDLVQIIRLDGTRAIVETGHALASSLIMPRSNGCGGFEYDRGPDGGWVLRRDTFDRESERHPLGWHGPFESYFILDDTGAAVEIRFRERGTVH